MKEEQHQMSRALEMIGLICEISEDSYGNRWSTGIEEIVWAYCCGCTGHHLTVMISRSAEWLRELTIELNSWPYHAPDGTYVMLPLDQWRAAAQ